MSRQIDLTKPLSDADRVYLEKRGRSHEIARADKAVGATRSVRASEDASGTGSAGSGGDSGQEEAGLVDYGRMTVPQLKEEMDKRRARYEAEQDAEGVELMTYASDARKDDLVTALNMDSEEDSDEE